MSDSKYPYLTSLLKYINSLVSFSDEALANQRESVAGFLFSLTKATREDLMKSYLEPLEERTKNLLTSATNLDLLEVSDKTLEALDESTTKGYKITEDFMYFVYIFLLYAFILRNINSKKIEKTIMDEPLYELFKTINQFELKLTTEEGKNDSLIKNIIGNIQLFLSIPEEQITPFRSGLVGNKWKVRDLFDSSASNELCLFCTEYPLSRQLSLPEYEKERKMGADIIQSIRNASVMIFFLYANLCEDITIPNKNTNQEEKRKKLVVRLMSYVDTSDKKIKQLYTFLLDRKDDKKVTRNDTSGTITVTLDRKIKKEEQPMNSVDVPLVQTTDLSVETPVIINDASSEVVEQGEDGNSSMDDETQDEEEQKLDTSETNKKSISDFFEYISTTIKNTSPNNIFPAAASQSNDYFKQILELVEGQWDKAQEYIDLRGLKSLIWIYYNYRTESLNHDMENEVKSSDADAVLLQLLFLYIYLNDSKLTTRNFQDVRLSDLVKYVLQNINPSKIKPKDMNLYSAALFKHFETAYKNLEEETKSLTSYSASRFSFITRVGGIDWTIQEMISNQCVLCQYTDQSKLIQELYSIFSHLTTIVAYLLVHFKNKERVLISNSISIELVRSNPDYKTLIDNKDQSHVYLCAKGCEGNFVTSEQSKYYTEWFKPTSLQDVPILLAHLPRHTVLVCSFTNFYRLYFIIKVDNTYHLCSSSFNLTKYNLPYLLKNPGIVYPTFDKLLNACSENVNDCLKSTQQIKLILYDGSQEVEELKKKKPRYDVTVNSDKTYVQAPLPEFQSFFLTSNRTTNYKFNSDVEEYILFLYNAMMEKDPQARHQMRSYWLQYTVAEECNDIHTFFTDNAKICVFTPKKIAKDKMNVSLDDFTINHLNIYETFNSTFLVNLYSPNIQKAYEVTDFKKDSLNTQIQNYMHIAYNAEPIQDVKNEYNVLGDTNVVDNPLQINGRSIEILHNMSQQQIMDILGICAGFSANEIVCDMGLAEDRKTFLSSHYYYVVANHGSANRLSVYYTKPYRNSYKLVHFQVQSRKAAEFNTSTFIPADVALQLISAEIFVLNDESAAQKKFKLFLQSTLMYYLNETVGSNSVSRDDEESDEIDQVQAFVLKYKDVNLDANADQVRDSMVADFQSLSSAALIKLQQLVMSTSSTFLTSWGIHSRKNLKKENDNDPSLHRLILKIEPKLIYLDKIKFQLFNQFYNKQRARQLQADLIQ